MAIEINSTGDTTIQSNHASPVEQVEKETDKETNVDSLQKEEPTNINQEPTGDIVDSGVGSIEKEGSEINVEDSEVSESTGLYFGENEITINVDPTHREELKAHGLDVDAVVSELFAKGNSDLKLSDETYGKLVKAFGKFSVDTYLSSLRQQVDLDIKSDVMAKQEQEKAQEALWSATLERVGGENGWQKLESFALENLSDSDLNDFNDVMNNGNAYTQKLAIDALLGQMRQHNGDGKPELIQADKATQAISEGSPLSRQDYIKEVARVSKEFKYDKDGYAKAISALDARRAKY